MNNNFAALILASGKGKRMNEGEASSIPKTLFELDGKPMLDHIHDLLVDTGFENIYVLVGYKNELVKRHLGDNAKYILQEEQNGTGHALQVAEPYLRDFERVLVVNGDTPFFTKETIKEMMGIDADIVMASSILEEPTGYGRIIRENNNVIDIREERETSDEEKMIKEVNAGCYVFSLSWLKDGLRELTMSPSGEYYITELPKIANKKNLKVSAHVLKDNKEAFGINTREDLKKAHKLK